MWLCFNLHAVHLSVLAALNTWYHFCVFFPPVPHSKLCFAFTVWLASDLWKGLKHDNNEQKDGNKLKKQEPRGQGFLSDVVWRLLGKRVTENCWRGSHIVHRTPKLSRNSELLLTCCKSFTSPSHLNYSLLSALSSVKPSFEFLLIYMI